MDDRCPMTDLLRSACAHCRTPRRGTSPQPGSAEAALNPGLYEHAYSPPVFPARYDGRCDACSERIYEGDDICMVSGYAVHADCVTPVV